MSKVITSTSQATASSGTTDAQNASTRDPTAKRGALTERLETAKALIACWRRGLPHYCGGADAKFIGNDQASLPQVSMRGICELLTNIADEYDDLPSTPKKPALVLRYALGVADNIESALWQQVSGEGEEPLLATALDRSAAHVQQLIGEALGWLCTMPTSQAIQPDAQLPNQRRAMPHELVHRVNHDLMNVIVLFQSIVLNDEGPDGDLADADSNFLGKSDRAVYLAWMGHEKVRAVMKSIEDYV